MRSPSWTRDEVILALDLYLRNRPRIPLISEEGVLTLSRQLKALAIHTDELRPDGFRSPASVVLKLSNLRALDPSSVASGLPAGSRTDREVWDEFSDNLAALEIEVRRIRATDG
jgi:5-methylcytosine-specific restriction protein A